MLSVDLDALVVIDTNILQTTNLLRDPVSITFLFHLRRAGGALGLPELILTEWTDHWVEYCTNEYAALRKRERWLHNQFGRPQTREMDIAVEAEALLARRIGDLDDLLVELNIEDDHWREAGEMVIAKRPPSSKGSQQFKDSLIWRSLLEAAQDRAVVFVTADKGFYDGDKPSLASSLAAEADDLGADITVARSLPDLMTSASLTSETGNLDDVRQIALSEFVRVVNDELDDDDFPLEISTNFETFDLEVFATERPSQVLAVVTLEAPCYRSDEPDMESHMWVQVSGSALVDLDEEEALDVELNEVDLVVSTPHNEEVRPLRDAPANRRSGNVKLRIGHA